ncbi:MAG: hypothetical protein ABR536_03600 [Solirubrobacterales bacterium]
MTDKHLTSRPRPRLRRLALIGAMTVVALGTGVAAAAKAPKTPLPKLLVLGASAQTAAPACPADPCQAIGKVTGFQTTIGKAANPFAAPFDGRIVAWSIKLSQPTDKQTSFFNDFYGGLPSARISILKPIKKRRGVYKLRNQTPVEQLSDVMGQTTTFTLKTPITVRTGQIVALSVPTWAPAFAIGLPKGNAWLASRSRGRCTDPDAIKAGSAQEALGTLRGYGCNYTTARLLYSATMIRGVVAPATSR